MAICPKHTAQEWVAKLGEWYVPDPVTGCWNWTRGQGTGGYGAVSTRRGTIGAHRVAYHLLRGPVPNGLQIDHLCRNRLCVNPGHMEPVTVTENVMRGMCNAAVNARKSHCVNGHELTADNVRIEATGSRRCLTCARLYHREYDRKNYNPEKRRAKYLRAKAAK